MAWHGGGIMRCHGAMGGWCMAPKGLTKGQRGLAKRAKGLGQGDIQLLWFVLPIFSKKIVNFEKDLEK